MIFNWTVIDMNDDMFEISYGIAGRPMLRLIAESVTSSLNTVKDDILNFFRP